MSVLLTAGRRKTAQQQKPRKKKKSAGAPRLLAFTPLPEEYSGPGNKIWRWIQDGTPYTLAFSKDTLDVWCNGDHIETAHSFAESGAIVDFAFNHMKCRITTTQTAGGAGPVTHALVVDGNCIPDEATMNAMMKQQNEPQGPQGSDDDSDSNGAGGDQDD